MQKPGQNNVLCFGPHTHTHTYTHQGRKIERVREIESERELEKETKRARERESLQSAPRTCPRLPLRHRSLSLSLPPVCARLFCVHLDSSARLGLIMCNHSFSPLTYTQESPLTPRLIAAKRRAPKCANNSAGNNTGLSPLSQLLHALSKLCSARKRSTVSRFLFLCSLRATSPLTTDEILCVPRIVVTAQIK